MALSGEGWNRAEIPLVEYNDVRKTVSNQGLPGAPFEERRNIPKSMPPPETEMIEIVVNGNVTSVPSGLDLEGLLRFLRVEPSRVAVEWNREIVRKPEWKCTTICRGDEIEVVQFVGGG